MTAEQRPKKRYSIDWQQRVARTKQPNLQEWVERHGGYHKIPWEEWDKAVAEWHALRLDMSRWP